MDCVQQFVDLFLHLDTHLSEVISQYGTWTYLILFLIVFCETGLVVTPFLPGDSLLFAAGTFAALGDLDVRVLMLLLVVAAILGDTVNYWVGAAIGPRAFQREPPVPQEGVPRAHRTRSTRSTVARRSSWRGSFRSSAPSRRSWPASGR